MNSEPSSSSLPSWPLPASRSIRRQSDEALIAKSLAKYPQVAAMIVSQGEVVMGGCPLMFKTLLHAGNYAAAFHPPSHVRMILQTFMINIMINVVEGGFVVIGWPRETNRDNRLMFDKNVYRVMRRLCKRVLI